MIIINNAQHLFIKSNTKINIKNQYLIIYIIIKIATKL